MTTVYHHHTGSAFDVAQVQMADTVELHPGHLANAANELTIHGSRTRTSTRRGFFVGATNPSTRTGTPPMDARTRRG